MSVLSGKNVLLGVTAGIAAYKSAFLVRLFVKIGANVKVVMTPASKDFVTPLTLSTLSKNEVHSVFFEKEEENERWNNHVEMGLWADLMIIAPATANTLSKMASGLCDNLLLATYLSAKCKVYFAPSMDLDMYKHKSTKENIGRLQSFGNIFIPPASGELASGLVGEGRMAEPEDIIKFIEDDLLSKLPLRTKKVLVTAGPTFEAIDPVRFIGNHSSGKMGFALADQAANMGAEVVLISGPSNEILINTTIKKVEIINAEEMFDACQSYFNSSDIAIFSAAVADYTPKKVASQKIKKRDSPLSIELKPTIDILATMGKQKKDQFLVGFALETNDEINNAKIKLHKKNLDLIVLNTLQDKGAGFKTNTNKVTLIDKNEKITTFGLKSKKEVAKDIFDEITNKLHA